MTLPTGVQIIGPITDNVDEVLTPEALAFVGGLHRTFNARRLELLRARSVRQDAINDGFTPGFLPETAMGFIPGLPLQLPFYFLGLLSSTIQALVFTLLATVYIALWLPHGDHGHDEAHGH